MENIIRVTGSVISRVFGNIGISFFITFIKSQPYVFVGTVLLVVGFVVGLLKRIIHV